jgi:hypothetical protein
MTIPAKTIDRTAVLAEAKTRGDGDKVSSCARPHSSEGCAIERINCIIIQSISARTAVQAQAGSSSLTRRRMAVSLLYSPLQIGPATPRPAPLMFPLPFPQRRPVNLLIFK